MFNFNPHSRVGSDTQHRDKEDAYREFQSTLPRGERPASGFITCYGCKISIHTPAWGATRSATRRKRLYVDFNPHSRVGSDANIFLLEEHSFYFNPHSRVGSDTRMGSMYDADSISIHTPAWGATCGSFRKYRSSVIFQSTLPRGERHCSFFVIRQ